MKLSIITAVYNSADTVGWAINSIANQSYANLEHLIIEGKSTDNSLDVIKEYAHPRMILHSDADTGIYDALNKGLSHASGDVIGFVHSDDFLANNQVIEKIARVFEDPNVDAVFSDLDYVSQKNAQQVIRHWTAGEYNPKVLGRGWMPPHPTLYLRKEVYKRLGNFDTNFRIAADYDLILRTFPQLNGKAVYIPEVFYKMRLGGASNRNFAQIQQKMREDYHAIKRNSIGGLPTLAWKNLSKLRQFKLLSNTAHCSQKKV